MVQAVQMEILDAMEVVGVQVLQVLVAHLEMVVVVVLAGIMEKILVVEVDGSPMVVRLTPEVLEDCHLPEVEVMVASEAGAVLIQEPQVVAVATLEVVAEAGALEIIGVLAVVAVVHTMLEPIRLMEIIPTPVTDTYLLKNYRGHKHAHLIWDSILTSRL